MANPIDVVVVALAAEGEESGTGRKLSAHLGSDREARRFLPPRRRRRPPDSERFCRGPDIRPRLYRRR